MVEAPTVFLIEDSEIDGQAAAQGTSARWLRNYT